MHPETNRAIKDALNRMSGKDIHELLQMATDDMITAIRDEERKKCAKICRDLAGAYRKEFEAYPPSSTKVREAEIRAFTLELAAETMEKD